MVDYDRFLIKRYKHWKVLLHSEFYYHYLGSFYIWSRRTDDVDILEMTKEEQEEFFTVARQVKQAFKKLFKPDRFNYLAMGNVAPHLHVHVIPRYASPRIFNKLKFVDKEWGGPPRSKPHIKVPEEALLKIRDKIKKQLETSQTS